MGRKKAAVVDEDTGEVLGSTEVSDQADVLFEEGYKWETPEAAIKAVSAQRKRCDRLESEQQEAKLHAKNIGNELESEESKLRLMLRSLQQLRLFKAVLLAFTALALGLAGACVPVAAAVPPQVHGSTIGWEDLIGRQDDFAVFPIEPGVALLVDARTGRGWILAGSPQAWQAIEPVGDL